MTDNFKQLVLLEEYKLINIKIEQFLSNQHKYINSVLLIIAAFLVFVFDGEQNHLEFVFALPFIFLCVFLVFLYHYKRTLALQGYKKYLELCMNNEIGNEILIYGKVGEPEMTKEDMISKFNSGAYLVIYCLLVALGYYVTPELSNVFIGIIIFYVVALFVVVAFAVRAHAVKNKVFLAAKNIQKVIS